MGSGGRYIGRVCSKHPELCGLRRTAGGGCVACDQERNRRRYEASGYYAQVLARHEARQRAAAEKVARRKAEKSPEAQADRESKRREAKRQERRRWRKTEGGRLLRQRSKNRRRLRVREQQPRLTAIERAQYQEFYSLAQARTAQTGVLWTVDHDKPLARGGLDHPSNMVLLPHDANSLKGAAYESTIDFLLS